MKKRKGRSVFINVVDHSNVVYTASDDNNDDSLLLCWLVLTYVSNSQPRNVMEVILWHCFAMLFISVLFSLGFDFVCWLLSLVIKSKQLSSHLINQSLYHCSKLFIMIMGHPCLFLEFAFFFFLRVKSWRKIWGCGKPDICSILLLTIFILNFVSSWTNLVTVQLY